MASLLRAGGADPSCRSLRRSSLSCETSSSKPPCVLSPPLSALRADPCRQYSPISRLPADLFLDIILLASTSSPREWNSFPTPRSKNPAPNPLLSAMHVSRTWYSAISSSPRLWSTLAIDGVINRKNAVEKAVWWSRRARGRRQGEDDAKDDAKGLKKIVVTAASEINPVTFVRLYEALKKEEAVGDLREFTISFVDGALNTFEATQASMSLAFLWEACESSLETLIYATEAKVHLQLDILRLGTKFPSLRDLRIWGGTGATVSLDSQALSKGCRSTDLKAPPPLVHLALHNCPVYGQKVELSDFPALRNLDLHITDATALWNILSTPSLKSCRLRVPPSYDFATPRQTNVSSAWRVIEDLALIGRSTIICTLLDLAVAANLALPFLTTLDLTGARLTDPRLSLFDSLNAPLLTSLNLRNSTYSPDPPFPSLHSLLSLNVANTSWTTDDFVRSLIAKTPRITQLNLSGNPLLTGRPIMELVRFRAPEEGSRSELVELRLEGCVGIETSAVEWLRKAVRPGGVRFMFMEAKEKAAKRPRLR